MRDTNNHLPKAFIFNCLKLDINLFIFSCLTSDINLFIFNCSASNFCFLKIISFASRRERLFIAARPYFRNLDSSGKIMTCYLGDANKFLRHHTLRSSRLKCRFLTKGIRLTQFILFEVFGVFQLWGTSV